MTVNNAPYKSDNSSQKQTSTVFIDTRSISTKSKSVHSMCIFLIAIKVNY